MKDTGRASITLFEQFSEYGPASAENPKLINWTTQFALGYRASDRWSLQLGLPYIDRKIGGVKERGIGDATAVVIFRAFEQSADSETFIIDVYAGLKMPTGNTEPLSNAGHHDDAPEHDADDEGHDAETLHAHGHHLALGSGSWDGLFGINALNQCGRWIMLGNAQYKRNTEGDYDFEYGDELTWLAGVKYQAVKGPKQSLAFGADLSGNWQDQNERFGEIDRSHSITRAVYAGPAVKYTRGNKIDISMAWDFAVGGDNGRHEGAADTHLRVSTIWPF